MEKEIRKWKLETARGTFYGNRPGDARCGLRKEEARGLEYDRGFRVMAGYFLRAV
jgi:hypothetical protein